MMLAPRTTTASSSGSGRRCGGAARGTQPHGLLRNPSAAAVWPGAQAHHHSCSSRTTAAAASCSARLVSGSDGRQHRRGSCRVAATQGGGLGDDQLDVAVFRFTLGIPGFDDSNIPRVVGAAVAALVAVNHALGALPAPPAQVRAEFLTITLAVLCLVAPELEARLREVGPGRGRASGAGQVEGAAQLFAIADGLPDAAKKELAWASFCLLKNVNCCSVLLLQPGSQAAALLARGAVAATVAQPGNSAGSLQAVAQGLSSRVSAVLSRAQQQVWLPDRAALQSAGLASCASIPAGIQSALLQAVPGGGVLLVLAERPRALSDKDRTWVAAIADKLGGVLA